MRLTRSIRIGAVEAGQIAARVEIGFDQIVAALVQFGARVELTAIAGRIR